jgi:hypothetical protein
LEIKEYNGKVLVQVIVRGVFSFKQAIPRERQEETLHLCGMPVGHPYWCGDALLLNYIKTIGLPITFTLVYVHCWAVLAVLATRYLTHTWVNCGSDFGTMVTAFLAQVQKNFF